MRSRSFLAVVMRFAAVTALVTAVATTSARAQVAPATGVTLTASVPSPQLAGTPVTFTALGVGSTGYQYQFWMENPNGTFTLVQDYGVGSTWTLPATTAPGTYFIGVHVRTGAGPGFDAQAWTGYVVVAPPATGVLLTTDKASPQPAGTPVVFTAAGTGSTGYEYRFWMQNANGTFTILQDYGVGASFTLPATTAPGTYSIGVWVRTSALVALDAQTWTTFTVRVPPATGVTLTPSLASPQPAGTPVVLTAAGIGSSGYQYRFWSQNPDGTFSIVQDYGVGSTWTIPATFAAGAHLFGVHVRTDPNGPFEAQAWIAYTLTPPPAPTIATVTPTSGSTGGGTAVTVAGANFAAGAKVTLGAVAQAVTSVTPTAIVFTTTSGNPGPVTLVVTNPDGQSATLASAFTYVTPPSTPAVVSVTPNTGTTTGGDTVVVTGANFQAGATVRFGGVGQLVTSVTATSITVITRASTAGTFSVTVTNPTGQFTTVNAAFTYVAPATPPPPPTIASLSPASGSTAGGTVVTVNGANFVAGATVTLGTVSQPVVSWGTASIVFTTVAAPAGAVPVTVTNPNGQTATVAAAYTFVAPPPSQPAPTIASITPTSGSIAGGTVVTLTGANFVAGAKVSLGAVAQVVSSVTPTAITFTTGASTIAGTVSVTVTNPDNQTATLASAFSYVIPPSTPSIASIAPASGSTAGGDVVTIAGANFLPGLTVTFGGLGQTVTSVTGTTVTITTHPAASAGAVTVVVTNPNGRSATVVGGFKFVAPPPPPSITSVTPATGAATGGTAVTISGANFAATAKVTFGGTAAVVTSVNAAGTAIVVTAPVHAAGAVSLTVTNPDGQSATLASGFTYAATLLPALATSSISAAVAPLAFASVAPSSGAVDGGAVVTLAGSGFSSGAQVGFGGFAATVLSVTADAIVVSAPAHAGGVVDVTVIDGAHVATIAHGFRYLGAPPTLASATIHGAPAAGGASVVLSGTGLEAGAAVTFGGVPARAVWFDAQANALHVTTPAFTLANGATEALVDVVVTNPDGQSATLSGFRVGPAPVAQAFTPSTLASGAAGQLVVVSGTGFDAVRGVRVAFGGAAGTVVAKTATTLLVATPALVPGVAYVLSVTNFDGQSSAAAGALKATGP